MFPVLFSFRNLSISSFGVFLAAGFVFGLFLIWRLARAWDLDEEEVLDLTLLTILGGLFFARVYFALEHLQFFWQNPLAFVLLYKIPGFSFWGGILGGFLTLYFLAKRKRVDFLQVGDIACVGLVGGLILSDLGCFLGSCALGIPSNLFFGVAVVGQIGKRFPTPVVEAMLLFFVFLKLWSFATHFHPRGKIFSLSLIYVGVVKLLMEPLKQSHEDFFLWLVLSLLGINLFYKVTSRSLKTDFKSTASFLYKFITSSLTRQTAMYRLKKYWYNQKTSISWKFKNLKRTLSLKKILRRFNVGFSYKNNKLH